ncbi:MAG: S1 family peptidase [Terriglobales bacterium]
MSSERSFARFAIRVAFTFVIVLAFALGGFVIYRMSARARQTEERITRLSAQVGRLSQEQAMPAVIVARHRASICYIYALYSLNPPPGHPFLRPLRTRVSGSGFLVARGMIATNRHVAQPWFDDDEDAAQIAKGYTPKLEKLLAFFPGHVQPVDLTVAALSQTADLALVRFTPTAETAALRSLPLAASAPIPGGAVIVVGYPMGVTAMLAKSPRKVYKRLAYSHDTIDIASDLAAHYLIRPSATYGHLGDVVEDKLIYDAPTAQGGSGGPVFDTNGDVIGVNSAYIDGFAGGTLGVSARALKPLLWQAQHPGVREATGAVPEPSSPDGVQTATDSQH